VNHDRELRGELCCRASATRLAGERSDDDDGDIDHMVGERCSDDDAGEIDQATRGRRGDDAAGEIS
jgi:hypothetical protein